jgi:hypothetical protein
VPEFYAKVDAPTLEPARVRGRVKSTIWLAPQVTYTASARPVWITWPSVDWRASVKVAPAPFRANAGWYVRPPTLKAKALVGTTVTGTWDSHLAMQAPEPRASFNARWKVPVGVKIKIAEPDLKAAANARMSWKLGATGDVDVRDHRADVKGKIDAHVPDVRGDVKGKLDVHAPDMRGDVKGKLDVHAPDVRGKVEVHAPEIKGGVHIGVNAGAKASADAKAAADAHARAAADAKAAADASARAAANAKASIKVQAPSIKIQAPSVKVKAKGSFKLGN